MTERTTTSTSRRALRAATLAILLASGLATASRAQNFPTPAKVLCTGEPSVANPTGCVATTTPAAFGSVFYAVTLHPATSGDVTLQESLPAGFNFLGATWTVAGSNQSNALTASLSGAVTTLGTLELTAGQTVVCFIRGYFTNPCSGVTNSVTVADAATGLPLSSPQHHNATVGCSLVFPSDLSVTKTVTPAAVDVSTGPQTVTYTIAIKNNGPEPVYIGSIGGLFDKISTSSNSVPMQVRVVPNSAQCTSSPAGTACLDPTPIGGLLTTATTTPASFVKWLFPTSGSNAAGYMPTGGTITLTYQVEIARHPDLFCAKGGEALHNEAFFALTTVGGTTITETNSLNNTSASPDVTVSTGQEIDPDCGVPVPGPIAITKTQISPAPSSTVAWNTPVTYRITLTNSDANAIDVRLRDRVMEWAGTPPFSASVTFCSPSALCTPPVSTPLVSLSSYFAQGTAWDKSNITIPGSGSVQLDLTLTYVPTSCDSFAAGGDLIRNIARADYTFGGTQRISEAWTDTTMASQPPCNLVVTKEVLDTDRVEFGVPLTDPNALTYRVTFKNAGTTPVTVGTLFDAVRLQQQNYATSLPFTYSYSCTASGTLTGPVPTSATGSGSIVYTTLPSQGARIIQSGPIVFGPNASLGCDVKLSVGRPATGDPNCLSSVEPRLENVALMDVSHFYNPNLQWPPSGSYSATTPVATSQPVPLTSWHAVSVKLPRCYRIVVNKSVAPGLTWAPGGPGLSYTVTITNAGDALNGSGLQIGDEFLAPWQNLAPFINVSSNCANPSAFWGSWTSGSPSVLPVSSFPAGCSIFLTFTLPGEYKPGQICNRGFARALPPAEWYASDPNPALLQSTVCVPVLATNDLVIRKLVSNNAGVELPGDLPFPMIVSCNTPGGTTVTSSGSVDVNRPQTLTNLPVGSNCWVTEQWGSLPVPGPGRCKPPAVPVWQAPVYTPPGTVIVPRPGENLITVTNTLDCVSPPVNTLTVVKTFAPPSLATQVPSDAVFPIQVDCSNSLSAVLNLSAPNYQQMVTSLPVGTLCKVSELPPQGTKIPPYCKWVQTFPGGNGMTIPATGNPTLVVQNELICTPPVDLALTKSSPTPVPGTSYFMFTITVTSPGGPFAIPPGGLTVTDTGTGMIGTFFSMSGSPTPNWVCTGTTTGGSCVYTGTGPTFAGQVLGTLTVYYQPFIPVPYVNCATATLAASAAGATIESDLRNNTACVRGGPAPPRIDLAIRKSGPVPIAGYPGIHAYTLTVMNPGPPFTMPANGLQVTDVATGLPGTFFAIGASPSVNWSCSVTASSGNCLYTGSGPIATGQVLGTISIAAHLPLALGRFTNCATVALTNLAPLVDPNPANDTSCVTRDEGRRRAVRK